MSDYDLILLSHHKCATNWLRSICKVLVDERIIAVDVVGGKKDGPENTLSDSARRVLLNVNANLRAGGDLLGDVSKNIHFVRDPRDAFVSNYFSWRYSHQKTNPILVDFRERAETMSVEDGMLYLIELFPMGKQLASWTDEMWGRVTQVRYESLLADFGPTFRRIFEPAGAPLTDEIIAMTHDATTFKKLSGRKDGSEDKSSHFRKGEPGDWQNYFTDKLSAAFFSKHGWLGERLGYW